MKAVYQCELCFGTYYTPEDATKCEGRHRPADGFRVVSVHYDAKGSPRIPKTIRVKFSDDTYDHGLYQLVHYGPKHV